MRPLDLPAYAATRHGYEVQWQNDEKSRASLLKSQEEPRAGRTTEGVCRKDSYPHE